MYLDAFVPDDGDTVFGLAGQPDRAVMGVGEPWLIPPPAREFDDPAEAAFAVARRTPHPVGCFTEPVRVSRPLEELPFARTYIRATADGPEAPATAAFDAAAARARTSSAWTYHEIATSHMIPNNRPDELAELLLKMS